MKSDRREELGGRWLGGGKGSRARRARSRRSHAVDAAGGGYVISKLNKAAPHTGDESREGGRTTKRGELGIEKKGIIVKVSFCKAKKITGQNEEIT